MSERTSWSAWMVFFVGQTAAMLGVGTTAFVVGVGLLEAGRGTSAYTTLVAVTALPVVLFGPWVGVWAERISPRTAVAVGLLGPGILSVLLAGTLVLGLDSPILAFGVLGLASVLTTVHWPAYVKATTTALPARVGRTSALMQLGIVAQRVAAPGVAAALSIVLAARHILLLDGVLATLGALSVLALPTMAGTPTTRSVWAELSEGFSWIARRRGLVVFLVTLGGSYASGGVLISLAVPMLLGLGGVSTAGWVMTFAGVGMVLGTLVAATWAPRQAVMPALVADGAAGLCLVVLGLRPDVLWGACWAFLFLFASGIHTATAQSVWQDRVPVGLQARVFAIRAVALFGALPVVYLVSGPLCEAVDTGLSGGLVANWLEAPALGIRVVFILGGLGKLAVLAAGLSTRALRGLEHDVPTILARPDGRSVTAPRSGPR